MRNTSHVSHVTITSCCFYLCLHLCGLSFPLINCQQPDVLPRSEDLRQADSPAHSAGTQDHSSLQNNLLPPLPPLEFPFLSSLPSYPLFLQPDLLYEKNLLLYNHFKCKSHIVSALVIKLTDSMREKLTLIAQLHKKFPPNRMAPDLYSEGASFKYWPGHRLAGMFSWFYSVPLGKCQDNNLNEPWLLPWYSFPIPNQSSRHWMQ